MAAAHPRDAGGLLDLRLVTPWSGWLLTRDALLWSNDRGASWADITPRDEATGPLQDAFFLDASHGWLVPAGRQPISGPQSFRVFRTVDGGRSWRPSTTPPAPRRTTFSFWPSGLRFTDPRHGWLRMSPTALVDPPFAVTFQTADGGRTWTGPSTDWVGTTTWAVPIPPRYAAWATTAGEPVTMGSGANVLPVTVYDNVKSAILIFSRPDANAAWQLAAALDDPFRHPYGQDQGIMTSISDGVWAVVLGDSLLEVSGDSGLHWRIVRPTPPLRLASVDFATVTTAWAGGTYQVCSGTASTCPYVYGALRSDDGGTTWAPM